MISTTSDAVWYAMKTTFKRELKAKAELENRAIECFIPMMQRINIKAGKKIQTQVPAIHNLIFVKANKAQLSDIKLSINYLHNRLTSSNGALKPIIVPTKQMEQFINAVSLSLDKISYDDPSIMQLTKGTLVRVIDGDFKGYEGVLQQIKGKRTRRVIINIEGVVVYKIDVEARFIEKV